MACDAAPSGRLCGLAVATALAVLTPVNGCMSTAEPVSIRPGDHDVENDETVPYAAALSTALGTECFRAHRWRIATLPSTAGRDAMSVTSLDTTANGAQPH